MLFQQVRRSLGLLLLIFGTILFACGVWPSGKTIRTLTIFPWEMQLASSEPLQVGKDLTQVSGSSAVPAVLEVRSLIVESPILLRVGDPGIVHLDFIPVPAVPGSSETQDLQDIFDTYNVAVEARLEMGGLEVSPAGALTKSLLRAQPVSFGWELVPPETRRYEGTVWFYLRFLPKDGSPGESRPVSAQRLEIRSAGLWGLKGSHARIAGGAGTLVGLALASDLLSGYIGKRRSFNPSTTLARY